MWLIVLIWGELWYKIGVATTKEKRLLILILLLAAFLRCGLLWAGLKQTKPLYTPDSENYCRLARQLFYHGDFQLDGKAVIFRTPGYPVVLMLREVLPTGVVLGVQVAVDVAVVFMTFLLGAWLVSARVGLWSAGLYAITPLAMSACCRFLSDSAYLLFFTLALLLMVRHFRSGGWRSLAGSAVSLAVACYIRPVGQVMVVLFLLALLLRPKRIHRLAVFAGLIVLCLAPWAVRNAVVADYYGFSSFAGDSMYRTTAADIIARKQNTPAETIRRKHYAASDEYELGPPRRTVGQVARWRQREAMRIIRANPKPWLRGYFNGCLGFWLPGANDVLELLSISQGQRGTVDVLQRQGLWSAARHYFGENVPAMLLAGLMILILIVKYIGLAVCVVCKTRLSMPAEVWLLAGVVLVTAFLPGPGLGRYRLPVEPILALAAAAGWVHMRATLARSMT